jgi:hypothetical protein
VENDPGDVGSPGDARFTRARQIGGLMLFGLAIGVMLIDAMRPDYSVDTIQLGLVLGTGAVSLGVDAARRLLK